VSGRSDWSSECREGGAKFYPHNSRGSVSPRVHFESFFSVDSKFRSVGIVHDEKNCVDVWGFGMRWKGGWICRSGLAQTEVGWGRGVGGSVRVIL